MIMIMTKVIYIALVYNTIMAAYVKPSQANYCKLIQSKYCLNKSVNS